MNIGITGAFGFIGNNLVNYLLENTDYKLTLLDINSEKNTFEFINSDRVRVIIGDLTVKSIIMEFLKEQDVIVHLAGSSRPMSSFKDCLDDFHKNLYIDLSLFSAIQQNKEKMHLIYASSGGTVYSDNNDKIPLIETQPCFANAPYGIMKIASENYIKILADSETVTANVLRISNPYGALLPQHRKQGLIGVALNQIKNGQDITIFGDPNNIRDYISLYDVSSAIEKAIKYRKDFNVLNIGSGKGFSVLEIIDLLKDIIEQKFITTNSEIHEANLLPSWNVLDITKAKKMLQWKPEIDLRDGIMQLCKNEDIKIKDENL